jgi:hypothetical protein
MREKTRVRVGIRPRARIILPAWVQFVVSGVQLSRAEVEVPLDVLRLTPIQWAFSCSTPVE